MLERWNRAVKPLLTDSQTRDGSWEPGTDGRSGGSLDRVSTTAIYTLVLQIHDRYGRAIGVYRPTLTATEEEGDGD